LRFRLGCCRRVFDSVTCGFCLILGLVLGLIRILGRILRLLGGLGFRFWLSFRLGFLLGGLLRFGLLRLGFFGLRFFRLRFFGLRFLGGLRLFFRLGLLDLRLFFRLRLFSLRFFRLLSGGRGGWRSCRLRIGRRFRRQCRRIVRVGRWGGGGWGFFAHWS
jgi:hypothetical protein